MKRSVFGFTILALGCFGLTLAACGADEKEQPPAGPLSHLPPTPGTPPPPTGPGDQAGEGSASPSPSTCGSDAVCPLYQCACSGGKTYPSQKCGDDLVCADEVTTCARACEEALGERPEPPAGNPPVPKPEPTPSFFGCRLSTYNTTDRVRAVFFGAGTTEASARLAAIGQCREAGYLKTFCEDAVLACGVEERIPHLCTWTNMRPGSVNQMSYRGEGPSVSAASSAAVQKCIEGAWGAATCGSGSLTCAPR